VAFKTLLKRRLAHEPLAYILGEQGFYSLSFEVSSAVLIPRPETEKLVEVSLDIIKQKHLTSPYILDWGVGSGAVAISLAKEIPKAIVLGIDTSFSALQIAKNNIKRYQLDIALIAGSTMDVFKPNNFDIIVSNPPYIETAIIPTLSAEIKNYEPREALDGGEDGLKYIGYLLKNSATYLKPNGWLVMEIGYNQKSSIEKIISSLPFWQNILFFSDITGHDRVLAIKAGNG
jgi:release factor glutamine methyltransferase